MKMVSENMRVDSAGREFLESQEGCVLHTYYDQRKRLTIGIGHTGPDVVLGRIITRDQALQILSDDLVRFERMLNAECRIPMTQRQFNAAASLAFNEGCEAIRNSTMLRLYNRNDLAGAADAFLMWNKITKVDANGRPVVDPTTGKAVLLVDAGLAARRARERALFLSA